MSALSGDAGALISAFIIACLGTGWFAYVLRGLKNLSASARYGLYCLIWLAYFVLAWILATRL
ncbi:MAG: hypothetical protein AAF224_02440 [Pseudomonadota bacterium]